MGGQRGEPDDTVDTEADAEVPDGKAAQKAEAKLERRAERQRRQDERRRRWSRRGPSPEAPADDGPSGDGGTAVITLPPETVGMDREGSGPDGRGPTAAPAAPATTGPAVAATGLAALWQLLLAAHPRQAVLTAAAIAGLTALAGRPPEQVALLGGTVLVGQTMLGWHNDLVDRDRDAAVLARMREEGDTTRRRRKPVAEGRLEPGTVWYAFVVALLLLVPLSMASGIDALVAYLVAVAVGLLGNVALRGGWLSWLPWAASYALYPAFISYATLPGLPDEGRPPQPALVAIAAGIGIVVHVLRSLPGLVDDNREGRRHLPLRLALRTGAPRLLGLAGVLAVGLVIALLTVGAQVGLVR